MGKRKKKPDKMCWDNAARKDWLYFAMNGGWHEARLMLERSEPLPADHCEWLHNWLVNAKKAIAAEHKSARAHISKMIKLLHARREELGIVPETLSLF